MFVLGGKIIGYEGAGPLACIVATFTARINWYWQGWSPDYVSTIYINILTIILLYKLIQPFISINLPVLCYGFAVP